jgi:hypothetical protein
MAAIAGLILGTIAFAASIFVTANPTFAWLFSNVVGGLSHFGANYVLQRQSKEKIVKNFIVFNATGIVAFLIASAAFTGAIIVIQNQNSLIAWFCGSLAGTLSHFVLNHYCYNLACRENKANCKQVNAAC